MNRSDYCSDEKEKIMNPKPEYIIQWPQGDPAPDWIRNNEDIYKRFVEVEVQFRIKELDIIQQQVALQKDRLSALSEVIISGKR